VTALAGLLDVGTTAELALTPALRLAVGVGGGLAWRAQPGGEPARDPSRYARVGVGVSLVVR
jgi:hypothetical protein